MSGSEPFLAGVASRRSIYPLKNTAPVPDSKINSIVSDALKHVPSAFNSQSARVVILLKEEHEKLWDIASEILKAAIPAESFVQTEAKLKLFRGGYGTVLFFEDQTVVAEFQSKFAMYKDKFPQWSEQSNGMHQYVVWTALELEGFGANLQHYNPLIDQRVHETWNVDKDWQLGAQLVFGTPAAPPREKESKPLEERLKVYGASADA